MPLGNVHITPQLVQAVRDAIDIVAVASDHTKLRKAGKRYTGLCPLHKEKTPSFGVEPVQGLYYCFGCGKGGDAIKLHMELTGDDFPAAIESLARKYGIPLPSRSSSGHSHQQDRGLEEAQQAAADYFVSQLKASSSVQAYLAKREIPVELIERYGLGYALDGWDNLLGALHPRFSKAQLEKAGLIKRSERRADSHYDRFRHRLMFPIHVGSGRLVGFGGRALGDDKAKYINTGETEQFHKGSILFGLNHTKRAIRESGKAFLVEGYFDVLGAAAAGIEGAVASMGTALTPEQSKLLARFADEVILGYDGDAAGERAAKRAIPLLLAEGLGARRMLLPRGEDPDSIRQTLGNEALIHLFDDAPDAVLLELERLIPHDVQRDPRRQAQAGRAVAELLKPIGDGVLRYGYGRQAASRLGVPVDILWKRLGIDRQALQPEVKPAGPEGLVHSLEQRALQLLLQDGVEVPPLETLPAPDAFLDSRCRNIFASFCDLYGGGGAKPETQQLLAALSDDSGAVDEIARLLLERTVLGDSQELSDSLAQLARRWDQQRLRELSTRIQQAELQGNASLLESLWAEKRELSLTLHRRNRRPPPMVSK